LDPSTLFFFLMLFACNVLSCLDLWLTTRHYSIWLVRYQQFKRCDQSLKNEWVVFGIDQISERNTCHVSLNWDVTEPIIESYMSWFPKLRCYRTQYWIISCPYDWTYHSLLHIILFINKMWHLYFS
jgi:hypothetical protein